jgi:GTP cyclohydrolase I
MNIEIQKKESIIDHYNKTPLRLDAFEMEDEMKIELIRKHFKEIMHILGLDLTDDSLKETPSRVA